MHYKYRLCDSELLGIVYSIARSVCFAYCDNTGALLCVYKAAFPKFPQAKGAKSLVCPPPIWPRRKLSVQLWIHLALRRSLVTENAISSFFASSVHFLLVSLSCLLSCSRFLHHSEVERRKRHDLSLLAMPFWWDFVNPTFSFQCRRKWSLCPCRSPIKTLWFVVHSTCFSECWGYLSVFDTWSGL